MRLALVITSLCCLVFCCILFASDENGSITGDVMKIGILITAAVVGVLFSHLRGSKSHWKAALAAVASSGSVFAILGIVAVFLAPWESRWYERIHFALYIAVMAAMFGGAIGGIIGFLTDVAWRFAAKDDSSAIADR